MHVLGTQMFPQVHVAIKHPTRANNLTAFPQPMSLLHLSCFSN